MQKALPWFKYIQKILIVIQIQCLKLEKKKWITWIIVMHCGIVLNFLLPNQVSKMFLNQAMLPAWAQSAQNVEAVNSQTSHQSAVIFEKNVIYAWWNAEKKWLTFFLEEIHCMYTCYSYWFQKRQKLKNTVFWVFVFLVCSISVGRYTGTTIKQDIQQAVLFDTYWDLSESTVLCNLMFVQLQHACCIIVQWKWSHFLSFYCPWSNGSLNFHFGIDIWPKGLNRGACKWTTAKFGRAYWTESFNNM